MNNSNKIYENIKSMYAPNKLVKNFNIFYILTLKYNPQQQQKRKRIFILHSSIKNILSKNINQKLKKKNFDKLLTIRKKYI